MALLMVPPAMQDNRLLSAIHPGGDNAVTPSVDVTSYMPSIEVLPPTAVAPTAVAPTAVAPTAVAPTAVAPTAVAPTAVAPTAPLDQQGNPVDLAWLADQSQQLEGAHPREIIAWGVKHYFPKLTMSTAFGPEGCLIIHWLADVEPRTPVFNLDTGYQFAETLELREQIARRYGIEVELKRPDTTVEQYEAQHGGPLYRSNPDQCCLDRKVKVLRQAAVGMRAWMSGIRRDQSPDRAKAPIVAWDYKFSLVKISPVANWTKQEVWKLIVAENVPYNPLHDQGYTSIGCWPCTRAVMFGEDERAGRWSGTAKTECGLHTE